MTMSRNSKELTLRQVNYTPTLWIESEIIFIFACASHLLVKNSEIDLENSLLFSTNAQSTGSCPGPKKH